MKGWRSNGSMASSQVVRLGRGISKTDHNGVKDDRRSKRRCARSPYCEVLAAVPKKYASAPGH